MSEAKKKVLSDSKAKDRSPGASQPLSSAATPKEMLNETRQGYDMPRTSKRHAQAKLRQEAIRVTSCGENRAAEMCGQGVRRGVARKSSLTSNNRKPTGGLTGRLAALSPIQMPVSPYYIQNFQHIPAARLTQPGFSTFGQQAATRPVADRDGHLCYFYAPVNDLAQARNSTLTPDGSPYNGVFLETFPDIKSNR